MEMGQNDPIPNIPRKIIKRNTIKEDKTIAITVIDSVPGSYKTTWAIQEINTHPERLYLIIVPLRTEISRYRDAIHTSTYTPIFYDRTRQKLDNLKELIEMGVNIVSTHALFLSADREVVELLRAKNYYLIIDEALSVSAIISVSESYVNDEDESYSMKDIPRLKPSEIHWLLENNHIEIMEDKSVHWLGHPTGYHRYQWVENLCNNEALTYLDGEIMMWNFPPVIFDVVSEVYLLTYLFRGSLMESYMELFKKKYILKCISEINPMGSDNKRFRLVTHNPKAENRQKYKDLINLCGDNSLNAIGTKSDKRYPLSVGWYKNNNKGQKLGLKALKNNTLTYLRNRVAAPRESVMLTTYKNYVSVITPKGYKTVDDEKKESTYVSCNAKASNDYRSRYNLVYLCDRHLNPNIIRFFENYNIVVDRDNFSLSELLQWVFRSKIRNGEKINLYLPSSRMRNLLLDWLSEAG